MSEKLVTNRPTLKKFLSVPHDQIPALVTAMGEQIVRNFTALKADIAPAADKRFVLFKNKFLWFDRDVAGLFPRMEKKDLPCVLFNDGTYIQAYSEIREGFKFVPMTTVESGKSFIKGIGNPYQNSNGTFNEYLPSTNTDIVLTGELASNGLPIFTYTSNGSSNTWNVNDRTATLVPIHRLRGKNATAMTYPEALLAWIANGLIPEGLVDNQEKFYRTFMTDYSNFADYISLKGDTIKFNIASLTEKIIKGQAQLTASPDLLKKDLLECDHKRADLEPYDERQLTDVNRGHWELFEADSEKNSIQVQLPAGEMLVARPPQLDVSSSGICAIDFGTKSTIVVCRDGEARMLRVGKGDYSKAPTMADFENPTVIHLRDAEKFLAAYRARSGRPFTEWNQVTVSHQAADAIFKNDVGSSVYNSVFSELKQWAKDEQSYPVLKDLQNFTQEIKPFLETKEIAEGDFDPIEIYAYYLGLYINNMHRKIYLNYIMSFPVNYRKDIRERIRQSFERGIKKSLPPALLADEEAMKRFRVYPGASEPAAYAISALEGFGLEPTRLDEKVAYGVFDFGGGTTDFDFGVEYMPEDRKRNFIIEQFGFNGDVTLGGENILELLAYEVYKDNLAVMREKKIPFALPAGCEIFAGAETLVSTTKGATAHMNNRILSEKLRPIWQNTDERKNLTEAPLNITLFSSEEQAEGKYTVAVNLKIDADKLDKCIEERIRVGVENFFQALNSAFKGREIYPVHIFLAGNSCRSPVVKKLFDEFISRKDADEFVLHMPLGMAESADEIDDENSADEQPAVENLADEKISPADANVMALDRQRTGKTGVAFGLLRCRRGGKDVQIINKNVDDGGEMIFQYFLGDAGSDGNTFTVKIGRDVGYGKWTRFTVADEPEFEIYYTTEPRALEGKMPVAQVSMLSCLLDEDDTNDDEKFGVYIRKVSPNRIEYATGYEEDFAQEFTGKIYSQTL